MAPQPGAIPVAAPEQFQIPPPVMTELSDGVYHYFGFFSSSLIVIDGDQMMITDNTVTTIALTHEHYDHSGGTGPFPDAEVICHRNCAPIFALDSLGDVPQVDRTFDKFLAVGVGGKTVELHYLGSCDGKATTVIYMPDEKVIVTLDMYEPRAFTHHSRASFIF